MHAPRETAQSPSKLFFFEQGSVTAVVSGVARLRKRCPPPRLIVAYGIPVTRLVCYAYGALIAIAFNGMSFRRQRSGSASQEYKCA